MHRAEGIRNAGVKSPPQAANAWKRCPEESSKRSWADRAGNPKSGKGLPLES